LFLLPPVTGTGPLLAEAAGLLLPNNPQKFLNEAPDEAAAPGVGALHVTVILSPVVMSCDGIYYIKRKNYLNISGIV
jgi:hypothetical protein